MTSLLVLAHPDDHSFNAQILQRVQQSLNQERYQTWVADLYRMGFNPVLSLEEIRSHTSFDPMIQDLSRKIKAAKLLVFVYPDWWGGPPAILKGFLDRIFRPGVAYDFMGDEESGRDQVPLFNDKGILVFSTTDRDNAGYSGRVWQEQILPFCGAKSFRYHVFLRVRDSDYRDRVNWLNSIPKLVKEILEQL